MKTVKEVSRISGVSVRTLHHYDAIGLLPPTEVTDAGYRLYDDRALRRLQAILMFRELEFPLREIREILDSPDYDPAEALSQQIHMLELRRAHIDELLALARDIQNQGGITMSFEKFQNTELEQYKKEAKARWGHTDAYREYESRPASPDAGSDLMAIFAEFGRIKELPPEGDAAQTKVAQLQTFITDHYYTCTKPILAGLGQMYTGDDRFRANIDKAGGEGTAEFAAKAIGIYCSK